MPQDAARASRDRAASARLSTVVPGEDPKIFPEEVRLVVPALRSASLAVIRVCINWVRDRRRIVMTVLKAARMTAAGGTLGIRTTVPTSDSIYCPYTNRMLPSDQVNDEHIVPLALGGDNAFVLPVCRRFNSEV